MTAHRTVSWEDAVLRLIADPASAELVRDCYYDAPLEKAAERYHASPEWSSVRSVIGKGPGTALDVGAGNGIVSFALAKDGWNVSALEPDPSDIVGAGAIRRLSAYGGRDIRVLEAFGEKVDLPPSSFDLVIARQVVHHAQDLNGFCREMSRLLKSGGIFFSFRDHVADDVAQKEQFFREHPLHHLYGGENAYSGREYHSALEGAGLRVMNSWGHFAAPFNFAPSTTNMVVLGAARKVLPGALAGVVAKLLSGALYPSVGRLLSRLYRHPGRHIAFLARKP